MGDFGTSPQPASILPFHRVNPRIHRMPNDRYESPLATRNASAPMLKLFSPQTKYGLWRRLWVELPRAERELGISSISTEAIQQMEAKVDAIDFAKAAE